MRRRRYVILVIALVAAFAWIRVSAPEAGGSPTGIGKLRRLPLREAMAAQGEYFALTKGRGDQPPIDTAGTRRLTLLLRALDCCGSGGSVSWAPDGRASMAFGENKSTHKRGLWLCTEKSQGPEVVAGTAKWTGAGVDWAPDSSVALVSEYHASIALPTFLYSLADRSLRRLASEGQPRGSGGWSCWSPDGRSNYFATRNNAQELWRVDIPGCTMRRVYVDPAARRDGDVNEPITCMAMSPDSRLLAFSRTPTGRHPDGVWVVDLATRQATRVAWETSGRIEHAVLSWSPDSQAVRFSRRRSNYYGGAPVHEVWSVDVSKLAAAPPPRIQE